MVGIGFEQDAPHVGREAGRQKNLRQVVDVVLAAACRDASQLLFLGELEENAVGRYQGMWRACQMPLHPPACGLMQVMLWSDEWVAGLVADDAELDSFSAGPPQEFDGAWVSLRLVHARAVDRSLHLRPYRLTIDAAKVVAHRDFGLRQVGGDNLLI